MAQIYPEYSDSTGIYFCYLLRFKDLALRYSRATWRLPHNDEEMAALAEQENMKMNIRNWLEMKDEI